MSSVPPPGASLEDSTAGPGSTSWRSVPSGSLQWLRLYLLLFSRVPVRMAYVLVLPVVFTWFLHYNRPRRAVVRAMRRFGRRFPTFAALQTYLQFAFSLVDRHYLVAGRIPLRMVDEYEEAGRPSPVAEALGSSERMILLGSHFGTLEVAASTLDGRFERPVRPVAVEDGEAAMLLAGVGDPSRRLFGAEPPILADGSMRAGLAMLSALRRGQVLALKGDRTLPGKGGSDTVRVDFCGSPAHLPLGPARLAELSGASALVVSCVRTGPGHYRLASVPLARGDSPTASTQAYAEVLAEHARRWPNQWFNFFGFWEDDAEALASLPETVPPLLRSAAGLAKWVVPGLLLAWLAWLLSGGA